MLQASLPLDKKSEKTSSPFLATIEYGVSKAAALVGKSRDQSANAINDIQLSYYQTYLNRDVEMNGVNMNQVC